MGVSLLSITIEVFVMPNAAPQLELDAWLSKFLSSDIYGMFQDLKLNDTDNPWNVQLGSRSQPDLPSVRAKQKGFVTAAGGCDPVHGWVLLKNNPAQNVKDKLIEEIDAQITAYLEQNQHQYTGVIIDDIDIENFEGFEESDVRDYIERWKSYIVDHVGQKVGKGQLLRMDIGKRLPSHLENLVLGWLIKTKEIVILPHNLNEAYFLRYYPDA
jgi:hypothetical protein